MVFAVPPTSLWFLVLVSFLGLSVVLSCAIFRVVQACSSEVTSPLTSVSGNYGGGIRTLMGSYPVYPRTASPLRYHTRHHCTLLIRLICLHFAFHVAAVSSFTILISLFHLTAVRLLIEHCLRSHTQTFKEGFMCLTGNLGFGFPSVSFRSKLYLSSLTTLTSRLVFILVRADVYYVNRKLKKKVNIFLKIVFTL